MISTVGEVGNLVQCGLYQYCTRFSRDWAIPHAVYTLEAGIHSKLQSLHTRPYMKFISYKEGVEIEMKLFH